MLSHQLMNYEEALKAVNAEVSAKEDRQLGDAEETVLRSAWQGETYEEMAETSRYSLNYLKQDVGPKVWRLLSKY